MPYRYEEPDLFYSQDGWQFYYCQDPENQDLWDMYYYQMPDEIGLADTGWVKFDIRKAAMVLNVLVTDDRDSHENVMKAMCDIENEDGDLIGPLAWLESQSLLVKGDG